ncbi:MAG: hypothetical protein KI790_00155 [Cyclobacteriaceae bacterium]|nr:hypothetical protein [Cyclobacteriaceae bacterium HetDA_MAG_MS6]
MNQSNLEKKAAKLFFLTLFFWSCGGSGNQQVAEDEVSFSDAEQKIVGDIGAIIHDLPPPSIVPNTLKKIGTEFDPDVINDIHKISDYQVNEDKAALNLGVYATDVGYMISYGQVQQSMEAIDAITKLAETIGVSTAFDMQLIEKYERNLGNADSLTKILNETVRLAEDRLEHSDRLSMAALVLTGSFVEGLYLVIRIIESYPSDINEETRNRKLEPLVKILLEQKKPLLDVIALMKDIPHDDAIRRMISELSILRLLYDGDLAEIEARMKDTTSDFVMTTDMLIDITTEVKRIRGEIVE